MDLVIQFTVCVISLMSSSLVQTTPLNDSSLWNTLSISKLDHNQFTLKRNKRADYEFVVTDNFEKRHIRRGDCKDVYALADANKTETFKENLQSTRAYWKYFTNKGRRRTHSFILSKRDIENTKSIIETIVKQISGKCKKYLFLKTEENWNCTIEQKDFEAHGIYDIRVATIRRIEWYKDDVSFKKCECGPANFAVGFRNNSADKNVVDIHHFFVPIYPTADGTFTEAEIDPESNLILIKKIKKPMIQNKFIMENKYQKALHKDITTYQTPQKCH